MGAGASVDSLRQGGIDSLLLQDQELDLECAHCHNIQPTSDLTEWFSELAHRDIFIDDLSKPVTVKRCGLTIKISAMALACYEGEVAVCDHLLEAYDADDDVTTPDSFGGFTPLMLAAIRGHVHVCEWLVANGADGDVRTSSQLGGHTAFMLAASCGHLNCAKWLVANGADGDIWRASKFGASPLAMASKEGHFELVKWLIFQGAAEGADGHVELEICSQDIEGGMLQALLEWCREELAWGAAFAATVLAGACWYPEAKASRSSHLWKLNVKHVAYLAALAEARAALEAEKLTAEEAAVTEAEARVDAAPKDAAEMEDEFGPAPLALGAHAGAAGAASSRVISQGSLMGNQNAPLSRRTRSNLGAVRTGRARHLSADLEAGGARGPRRRTLPASSVAGDKGKSGGGGGTSRARRRGPGGAPPPLAGVRVVSLTAAPSSSGSGGSTAATGSRRTRRALPKARAVSSDVEFTPSGRVRSLKFRSVTADWVEEEKPEPLQLIAEFCGAPFGRTFRLLSETEAALDSIISNALNGVSSEF